jgi:hypothetical protein
MTEKSSFINRLLSRINNYASKLPGASAHEVLSNRDDFPDFLSDFEQELGKGVRSKYFYLDESDIKRANLFEAVGKIPGIYLQLTAHEGPMSMEEFETKIDLALHSLAFNEASTSKKTFIVNHEIAAKMADGSAVVARLDFNHL